MWRSVSVKYDYLMVHAIPGSARGLDVEMRCNDIVSKTIPSTKGLLHTESRQLPPSVAVTWCHPGPMNPVYLCLHRDRPRFSCITKPSGTYIPLFSITSHITKFDHADNASTPKEVLYSGGHLIERNCKEFLHAYLLHPCHVTPTCLVFPPSTLFSVLNMQFAQMASNGSCPRSVSFSPFNLILVIHPQIYPSSCAWLNSRQGIFSQVERSWRPERKLHIRCANGVQVTLDSLQQKNCS
jgi:hypothetical protein